MLPSPETLSPLERLVLEHALVLCRETQSAAENAPDGQVLDLAESMVIRQGRKFIQTTLNAIVQEQADLREPAARTCPQCHQKKN